MSKRYARNPAATQVEQWKRALAAHHRDQRARRWKRPERQITGIRIVPGKNQP